MNSLRKLTKGVLFHEDNAPAHKSVVAKAAVRDCDFELVDHPLFSWFGTIYFLLLNMKKKIVLVKQGLLCQFFQAVNEMSLV